jgi:hypothetical protein
MTRYALAVLPSLTLLAVLPSLAGAGQVLVFRGGLRLSAQPENLVTYEGVQQELKMTAAQIARVGAVARRMANKHTPAFQALRGFRDVRASVIKGQEVHKAAAEETLAALADVLKPAQVARLKQIYLQEMTVFAFLDPAVQTALKLNNDQKTRMQRLAADTIEKQRDAVDHARGNRESQEKCDLLRQDSREKALAILNAAQQKTWKDRIGEPFEVQVGPAGPGRRP